VCLCFALSASVMASELCAMGCLCVSSKLTATQRYLLLTWGIPVYTTPRQCGHQSCWHAAGMCYSSGCMVIYGVQWRVKCVGLLI
jgi:hypothetical protein